jgi:hypothetical protein
MVQYGAWSPYTGNSTIILAGVLLVIAGICVYLGTRLHGWLVSKRPGKYISFSIIVIWFLSVSTFLVAIITYGEVLIQQVGPYTPPKNPITPITAISALISFIVIAYLSRRSGFWIALGSAIVGVFAAPMIFELPFDLIVMWRTFAPAPATRFTLLFFLPLFLVEISTFALLTLSPLTKLSRYTLFSLAAMFFVFAVWALFGFSYPFTPAPIAFNMISKILGFVAAVTLFLPLKETSQN